MRNKISFVLVLSLTVWFYLVFEDIAVASVTDEDVAKASYCYDDCTGNGKCVDYRCICNPGWHGERCHLSFSDINSDKTYATDRFSNYDPMERIDPLKVKPVPALSIGKIVDTQKEYDRLCQKSDLIILGISSSKCAKCESIEPEYIKLLGMLKDDFNLTDSARNAYFKWRNNREQTPEEREMNMLASDIRTRDEYIRKKRTTTVDFLRLDSTLTKAQNLLASFKVEFLPATIFVRKGGKQFNVAKSQLHDALHWYQYIHKMYNPAFKRIKSQIDLFNHVASFQHYFPSTVLNFLIFDGNEDTDTFEDIKKLFAKMKYSEYIYSYILNKKEGAIAETILGLFKPQPNLPALFTVRYDSDYLKFTLNLSETQMPFGFFGMFEDRNEPGAKTLFAHFSFKKEADIKAMSTAEVSYNTFNEKIDSANLKELTDFIFTRSVPIASELTGESFFLYEQCPIPMFILFFSYDSYKRNDTNVRRVLRDLRSCAKEYFSQAFYVYVDSREFPEHIKRMYLNLNSTEAAFTVNAPGGILYRPRILSNLLDFDVSVFRSYSRKVLDGEISPLNEQQKFQLQRRHENQNIINPQDIPEDVNSQDLKRAKQSYTNEQLSFGSDFSYADDHVMELTAQNYDEVFLEADDLDIVIFVHRSGHDLSKQLSPYYKKVVSRFGAIHSPQLSLLRLDMKRSWVPPSFLKISELPLPYLLIFPAFQRPASGDYIFNFYTGEFKVVEVMSWIHENCYNKFQLPSLFQFDDSEKSAFKDQIRQREKTIKAEKRRNVDL